MSKFFRPEFKRSVSELASASAQATGAPILDSPFDENYVDQIKISKDCDSPETNWPPYNGCNGTVATPDELKPGTLVDRFGRLSGEFFSPAEETFRKRSLKQIMNKPECKEFYNKKYSKDNKYTATGKNDDWRLLNDYSVLKVIKPLSVVKCTAAPAFDQPGGAIQYWVPKNMSDPFAVKVDKTPDNYTIEELIARGDLELLNKHDPPNYEGGFIKRKSRKRKGSRRRKSRKRKGSRRRNK
jgi:hypothetical protein